MLLKMTLKNSQMLEKKDTVFNFTNMCTLFLIIYSFYRYVADHTTLKCCLKHSICQSPRFCKVGPAEEAVTFRLIGVWVWAGGFVLFGDGMFWGLALCCVRSGVRIGCCTSNVSPSGRWCWGWPAWGWGGGLTRLMWCDGWYMLEWWCGSEWLWWWCECCSKISWWRFVVPDACFWSETDTRKRKTSDVS